MNNHIDSNFWQSAFPKESKFIKIKYISKFINGYAFSSDDFLDDGKNLVIRIGDIASEKVKIDSCSRINVNVPNMFRIEKNDILIAMSGATAGKTAIYDHEHDNAYINQRVGIIRCYFFRNIFYSLQTTLFTEYVKFVNQSSAQPNISGSQIGNYIVNLEESYLDLLDKKVHEILKLIENQLKQIDKLKEYKQSLISEIVTRGLNPNIEMKDNRFEWIGVNPKSWRTIRIKDFTKLKGRIGWQGLTTSDYIDEGPYLVTGTDFYNGIINWNTCVHISDERYYEAPEIHLMEGDLLITKDGTIGKVAIVKDLNDKASLNSGVLLIRVLEGFEFHKRFLYYVLQSNEFWVWYNSSQTGSSTIKHLYQNQFSYFAFTYPNFNEQKKISSYLNERVSKIDSLVAKKNQKIIMLNEYKKSLIYEYVTGKKEV
ncbi:MAG: restriction endonuclease subunit S [Tenericutes bacterium]|nr:restriction endonuclease subunit S [Mycoplasmatota bacterium]